MFKVSRTAFPTGCFIKANVFFFCIVGPDFLRIAQKFSVRLCIEIQSTVQFFSKNK